jgi:hypothetical protein
MASSVWFLRAIALEADLWQTLTNLYNARPEWLRQAHADLDRAVFAAYGWDLSLSDDDLLAALLELNRRRPSA